MSITNERSASRGRLTLACGSVFLLVVCCSARVAQAQVAEICQWPDVCRNVALAPPPPETNAIIDFSAQNAPDQDPQPPHDQQDPQGKDKSPEPNKRTRGFFDALAHNLLDDLKHMPRRNSIYFLAGGGAAALAVHPADSSLNRHLVGSPFFDKFFIPGKYVGATEVQIGVSLVTYFIGREEEQPRVQHIGMDMLEAQILAEGIVEATKVIVRRPRPVNPDGSHAAGYAFPSGHAAVTFATATVFQEHFGWKAAVPTYALATYVAASRLHDNRHYVSDVVFGSATGIIIGRSVTWHGRNTFSLAPVPMPEGLGIGGVIVW